MGCDIHAYLEKKNSDGTYSYVKDVFESREYNLFAFLAGVRNYIRIKPINDARGLPTDLSEYVKDEYENWKYDAHSVSWIDVDELYDFNYMNNVHDENTSFSYQFMTYTTFLGEHTLSDILKLGQYINHRIVFWFDN